MPVETPYSISQFQHIVKAVVERSFPTKVMLRGEVCEMNHNPSGHVYITLAENNGGLCVAKVKAAAWVRNASKILSKFRMGTGMDLGVGIEVVVDVNVSYNEQYGLTLSIVDIHPEFNIGARELQRRKTIDRLRAERLLDLQKSLTLCDIPYRLAVVSSATAAGLRDFRRQLDSNSFGFMYRVDLFEAIMQGDAAPASMAGAIARVQASAEPYDAVLILRGGGSELDLACFDDYTLAVAIADCPIPVYTAIGHDKDHHIADMVANTSVKTPTALAELFIGTTRIQDERISSLANRLRLGFSERFASEEKRLEGKVHILRLALERTCGAYATRLDRLEVRITTAAHRLVAAEKELDNLNHRIQSAAGYRVDDGLKILDDFRKFVLRFASSRLDRASHTLETNAEYIFKTIRSHATMQASQGLDRLTFLEARISMCDPRNTLFRQGAIVSDSRSVRITSVAGRSPGDCIRVILPDGRLDCTVFSVQSAQDPGAVGRLTQETTS